MNERKIIEESVEKHQKSIKKRKEDVKFLFQQPQMRFKARNTIERVFDVINDQSYGKIDKKFILSQFRTKLKKNVVSSNYTDYLEDQLPKYLTYNIIKLKDERLKEEGEEGEFEDDEQKYFIRTETNFTKNKVGNRVTNNADTVYNKYIERNKSASQAMNLLSDYHVKTHFKGASNFLLSKEKKSDSPKMINLNLEFPKNQQYINNNKKKQSSNTNEKKLPTNSINSNNNIITTIMSDEISNDIIKSFPLLYNFNSNKILKEKKNIDNEILSQLKTMSEKPFIFDENSDDKPKKKKVDFKKIFKQKDPNNNSLNNKLNKVTIFPDAVKTSTNFFEEEIRNKRGISLLKVDQDHIKIDNKLYTKDQINEMAKFILKKCNYLHGKNKKNEKMLTVGDGKTMITGGLSLKDFLKKHNLK